MYKEQKNKESKLQKSKSNDEFGRDKWIKEVLYPDFSESMVSFRCQREIARFVQETPDSSKIPSTRKIVPAMPETVKDMHRINCVTQKVKDKEFKLQKSQSNHIMCGSIFCLPTPRFAVKSETTNQQSSPEGGLRLLPDLTKSPAGHQPFTGEFEQQKWIEEVPYELTVNFSNQHKIPRFVREKPDSSKIRRRSSKSVLVVDERVSDKHSVNCVTQEAKEKQFKSQKCQSFSGEFEQVKWIKESPYPFLRLQSDSDLHNESTVVTFPSQSEIAPIHPRIAPFLFTNDEIYHTNRKTQ